VFGAHGGEHAGPELLFADDAPLSYAYQHMVASVDFNLKFTYLLACWERLTDDASILG
jgi:hypothetical protein